MRLTYALTFALVLSAAGGPLMARDISGEMAYRERIALPDGALLVVELRGAEGVVAEARIETLGRQVPLPFVLSAPNAEDYTLRGALFLGGELQWRSEEVAVPAGEGPAALGVIDLYREQAPFTLFDCGGRIVEAGLVGEDLRLRAGGERFMLRPAPSASGARWSDGGTPEVVFWNKGNAAQVSVAGEDLPECQPVIDDPLLPLTARGNEPFWRLEMAEGRFLYEGNLGETRIEGSLPDPVATAEGVRFTLAEGLAVTLDRHVCRDTMSGMPFPLTATLEAAGAIETGCAGGSSDMLSGRWLAQHVEGAVLPQGAEVSLIFDVKAGRVFGKSACNRYNAGFALTGEGLSFQRGLSTMMACPQDLMAVEQTFLSALETIDRFDITDDGELVLYAQDQAVIRATR